MSLVSGQDLIDAGFRPGRNFKAILAKAAEIEAKGISQKSYVLKLLKREFPLEEEKETLDDSPAPLAEAIECTSSEEEDNVCKVRKRMDELLRVPVVRRGAIMPDACPAGMAEATIPVGGSIAVHKAIIPAAHSADICCSMYATVFRSERDVEVLLDDLMDSTRFGPGGRQPEEIVHHPVIEEDVWSNPFLSGLENYARIHMADQGDGNHFAFVGTWRVSEEQVRMLRQSGHEEQASRLTPGETFHVLVTHHGSRGLGAAVYKRGQQAAEKQMRRETSGIPKAAAWLDMDSDEGEAYWEALQYVSRWTLANHESIHARFLKKSVSEEITAFGNEHNFVWRRGDTFLHGKGATPAWPHDDGRARLGLIPLNMASPILLVLGGDNEDYLSFAPHGAGRNFSRRALYRRFHNEFGEPDRNRIASEIESATRGLDVRWYLGNADLSETPVAYKSARQVEAQITQFGLAKLVARIEPLGCIMAGNPPPRQRHRELTPKQERQIEHRANRRKWRQKDLRDLED